MLAKGFSTPELAHPALPGKVSWFPLPPGWTLLGVLLLIAIIIGALLLLARYRRDRWRREARKQLARQQQVDGWLLLIKQVLLVQHSRAEVSQWQTPQQLLAHTSLDDEVRNLMCRRYCQPDNQLDAETNQRVAGQMRHWLESLPHV
ncbi:DUF4381 family protein [Pantoea sp.]|uniref:DUF4381 family protein n=1 Tax=Pantoea sp. TaxID=69393 RepID=UPI0031D8FDE3